LTENKLLPALCKLLNDSEADVRTRTLDSMIGWIHKISLDKINNVVYPSLKSLAQDSNNNVKVSLSKLLGIMSKHFGENITSNKL